MAEIKGNYATTFHVNDFAKARDFYKKAFGLKERMADVEAQWAEFELPDGSCIGAHAWNTGCDQNGGRAPGTVTGVILTVDDAAAFADHVAANGGRITDPVDMMPWGAKGGTVADPDGNEWVISEPMQG